MASKETILTAEGLRKLKEELIKMQTSKNIENAKVKIKK